MSAKDRFHNIVKHALIKDHWTITADPLYIRIEAIQLYLAVPSDTFDEFFKQLFVQELIQRYAIKLIIYQPEIEELIQWIP